MTGEALHQLLQLEYEQRAEIDAIRDAWSFDAEDARPLVEHLLERGIDPASFAVPTWPPLERTEDFKHDAGHLLNRLKGLLLNGHPIPWHGYDVRLERADRFDLEPRILRMGCGPAGLPEWSDLERAAGIDPEPWRHVIGPVYCAFGPPYPADLERPNVRPGDAIWIHTPWGTFPTWRWKEAVETLLGALVLANIEIVRYIGRQEPRPIWPYHKDAVIPTALPESQEIRAALWAYFNEGLEDEPEA